MRARLPSPFSLFALSVGRASARGFRATLCAIALASLQAPTAARATHSYADDRAAIENLMSAYLLAFDTLDAPALSNTFAPEGTLTLTGDGFPSITFTGRDGMTQFVEAIRQRNHLRLPSETPSFSPNVHLYGNLVLTVRGDSASATSYWFTIRRGANRDVVGMPNDGTSKFVSQGYYQDEFVRIGGHWLIKRRLVREMHPAQPG